MHNEVHIFAGAALQTYRVPGVKQLQKRLYVTRFSGITPDHLGRGYTSIWRLNINALTRWVDVNKTVHFEGIQKRAGSCSNEIQKREGKVDRKVPVPAIAIKNQMCWQLGKFQTCRSATATWKDDPPFQSCNPQSVANNVSEQQLWDMFAKPVNDPTHSDLNRYTRLTYGNGKLYYLNANTNKRATLRSTDVVSPHQLALCLPQ